MSSCEWLHRRSRKPGLPHRTVCGVGRFSRCSCYVMISSISFRASLVEETVDDICCWSFQNMSGLIATFLFLSCAAGGCRLRTMPQPRKPHYSLHIHGAAPPGRLHGQGLGLQLRSFSRCLVRCPSDAEVDFDHAMATDLSAWYRCPNEMASRASDSG